MRRYNLNEPQFTDDETDPDGFKTAYERVGPKVGGDKLGATHYLIRPGQHLCPYHYEYAEEEWLLVLEGRPTVRRPGGEDELEPGDLVCFPAGAEGAHKITNRGDANARVMLISTRTSPAVAGYPDSDKIAVVAEWGERVFVRRASAVDYYEGER